MSSDENKTMPTLEAVLERINEIGALLSSEIGALRAEMQAGFRRLDQKIDLLHKDNLEIRTDHKLLEQRVGDLERKAS